MANGLTGTFRSTAEGLKAATTTLNSGARMPWLGLGVWQIGSDRETEKTVDFALQLGYRSIDTAMIYQNERGVGQAVRSSGVPREQLFITTKLWNDDIRAGTAEKAFEKSLALLGLDYVDLYLAHWAIPGKVVSTWKAMEKLLRTGRTKSIGVSNHLRQHLDELLPVAEVVPAVNQIEFHPYLQSRALTDFCRARGIRVEAWSPLMQGGTVLGDPALAAIAKTHGKTAAQVILRWNVQSGIVTIPKSTKPKRIEENAGIFDFELTGAEMASIDKLDRDHRVGPDPRSVNF